MMSVSSADQRHVEITLQAMSESERDNAAREAHGILRDAGEFFRDFGKLDDDLERIAGIMIETIARHEAMKRNRGAMFRFWRRLSLVRFYFKGC